MGASPPDYAWTVTADVPWITISFPGPGTAGPSQVAYTVSANAGAPRQGTITAAGNVYTVTQAGAGWTPFSVIRTIGGLLYLGGMLVMAWNTWMTVVGGHPARVAVPAPQTA